MLGLRADVAFGVRVYTSSLGPAILVGDAADK